MIQIVSYGGGTNSLAMLVGLVERQESFGAVLFADTGSEKPHTYASVWETAAWLTRKDFPSVTVVRGSQPQQVRDGSLEAECLRLGVLPSRVYGFGSCSMKWKRDPQEKWKTQYYGEVPYITLIGFDADEPHRADRAWARDSTFRFPLLEWDWGRDECRAAITRAGLTQPGKSACFFCPSSRASEVMTLARQYPDLYRRAVAMETKALAGDGKAPALHTIRGLGRRWSWRDLVEQATRQGDLFEAGPPEIDCGCYDGE